MTPDENSRYDEDDTEKGLYQRAMSLRLPILGHLRDWLKVGDAPEMALEELASGLFDSDMLGEDEGEGIVLLALDELKKRELVDMAKYDRDVFCRITSEGIRALEVGLDAPLAGESYRIIGATGSIPLPRDCRVFISCGTLDHELKIGEWLYEKLLQDNPNRSQGIFMWKEPPTGRGAAKAMFDKIAWANFVIGFLHARDQIVKSLRGGTVFIGWTTSDFTQDELVVAGALGKRVLVFRDALLNVPIGALGVDVDVRLPSESENTETVAMAIISFLRHEWQSDSVPLSPD